MTLLDRVKDLCKAKGIALTDMEQRIGLSKGAIYKWNKSSPSIEVLMKLSTFFGVTVEFLMTGDTKNLLTIDPELNKLLALFESLSAESRKELIEYAEFKRDAYKKDRHLENAERAAREYIEELNRTKEKA